MPPKKKGKGKGKGKKGPVLIDGVDTSTMTRDQLEAFALRLKAEMEREREERNYYQLERDKIREFWDTCRQQLEEIQIEIRKKEREVEMAQEMADQDTTQIMQQMKHLQYENSFKIGEVRVEAMTQLQLAQEYHKEQEQELLHDKRELRRQILEKEETHLLQILQLKMKNSEELIESRTRFEHEAKDSELLHAEKMKEAREEIELVYRMQMFEVEERKNTQIDRLIEHHDAAFNDMKNYYNDITLNNLALISSLKEQMEVLRKQTERNERIAADTMAENFKLRDPLEAAQTELAVLRRKLIHFERDRDQLNYMKGRNIMNEKKLKDISLEQEVLLLRNETLVEQREEMKKKFEDLVMELQQKTSLKNVLLERKVTQLQREDEKRELLMIEMLAKCGAKVDVPKEREEAIRKMLDDKHKLINELQLELARTTKAHDDMLATYESKLKQFGIPQEELGFEPLRFSSKWKYLCGPAGLVTTNE